MRISALILFILMTITACSAKQENSTKKIKEENVTRNVDKLTFEDKYGGYSFSYPSYWKLTDHSASKDMIRADIYKDNNVGFQIRMYKTKDFRRFTDSYIKVFLREMQGHWKGTIKEEKREFSTKKGHEICKVWIYAEKQNGERWFFKEYLFQNNNNVVTFQSGIYFPYKKLYEVELDKIADSFSFK